jgi:hypothetical protein
LEKLCYYTADFEDIDDVINNEDFNLICCAAEEVMTYIRMHITNLQS